MTPFSSIEKLAVLRFYPNASCVHLLSAKIGSVKLRDEVWIIYSNDTSYRNDISRSHISEKDAWEKALLQANHSLLEAFQK